MLVQLKLPVPGAAAPLALSVGATFGLLGVASPACGGSSCQGQWWAPSWPALIGFDGPSQDDEAPRVFASYDSDGPGPMPPRLIAGGQFTQAPGGVPANGIAQFTGTGWVQVGPGFSERSVNDLITFDLDGPGPQPESLIAGGFMEVLNNIARWDGTTWHPIGNGLDGACAMCTPRVFAMAVYDSDGDGPLPERLFAGGRLGDPGNGDVRMWTGTTWQTVSGGVSDVVVDLLVHDFDGSGPEPASLVVAGGFLTAGGALTPVLAPRIARWDGTAWHGLGSGPPFLPLTIEIFDLDGEGPAPARLIVGGPGLVVPADVPHIVYWNGSAWLPLDAGIVGGTVRDLTVFDPDGNGPAPEQLLAVGAFQQGTFTPNNPNHIARWNGSAWEEFEGGATQDVYSISSFDFDDAGPLPAHLIVGGVFDIVGDVFEQTFEFSASFARWGCFEVAPKCPADLDDNGIVDGIDLAQLLVTWTGAASYRPCQPPAPADFNEDCKIDGIDLAVLLVSWGDQCP